MTELRRTLQAEVARFRVWADSFPPAERSGEWESLYAEWERIYAAFSEFTGSTICQEWDEEMIHLLLYIIARDNERQELAKEIAKHSGNLLCLVERGSASMERDAKWQLAIELGRVSWQTPEAESLLLQFAHDSDEYVKRCSLMALADIGSATVEKLASSAWGSGDEYQRMAVLYALWKIGSLQLDNYLTQADVDGRRFLVSYAEQIRNGEPH